MLNYQTVSVTKSIFFRYQCKITKLYHFTKKNIFVKIFEKITKL